MIKLPYKLLTYDIETAPLQAYIWRLGDQVVRHNQLCHIGKEYKIICIAYKWYHEKEAHVLYGDNIIEEFDKLARQADVCLGKNNQRFDIKHINTQRLLQGLKPYPEWVESSEDLERQLRKYFEFPSQSLDYISSYLGLGGKVKMEFNDWVAIENHTLMSKLAHASKFTDTQSKVLFGKDIETVAKLGVKALKKMLFYNKKDVKDTEAIFKKVLPYIKVKYNASTASDGKGCATCGSTNLIPSKTVLIGQVRYQQFECLNHGGYGGKATVKYNKNRNKIFGKIHS